MDEAWRERMEEAVRKDGRSLRSISLAAGVSHGYLQGILREDKEPTLDRFLRICREMNVSATYILMGLAITPADEGIIRALEGDGARRAALLALLKKSDG